MKKSDSACRAIRAATTETQVVNAVKEYLASLGPTELAFIPVELLAIGISEAEEIVQSALQLVNRELLGSHDAPAAGVLKDASLVLSTAAQRLAALAKDEA